MRSLLHHVGLFFARSFFPIMTLVVILGTLLWGPWVSLLIVVVLYFLMKQVA